METETFGSRLKQARTEAGLTQAQLAKRSGVSQTTISDSERGRNAGSGDAARIAAVLGVNALWLSDGRGQKTPPHTNTEPGPDIRGYVPLISWVQAGSWQTIIDNFAPGDAEEWMPCPVPHGKRSFVLRVRGESMWNPHGSRSFQDGDLIFVDPDREARHGSMVVVRMDDRQEATFKQLVVDGERRYLRALNPAWPDQFIVVDGNATICGVVVFSGKRCD